MTESEHQSHADLPHGVDPLHPSKPEAGLVNPESIDENILAKARQLFEVGPKNPKTYLGYRFAAMNALVGETGAIEGSNSNPADLGVLQATIIDIKSPLEVEMARWGDVVNNKQYAVESLNSLDASMDPRILHNLVTTLSILSGKAANLHITDEAFAKAVDKDNVDLSGVSNRELEDINNHRFLLKSAIANPSSERRSLQRQLTPILSGEFDSLLPTLVEKELTPDLDTFTEVIKEMDEMKVLDFTILPKGESLDGDFRDLSEKIYEESNRSEKTQVDLERIKVLKEMAELFGEENCTLARGKSRSGRKFDAGEGSSIDEDFIILAMKHPNGSEDALAISPISNVHAAFYTRQEANEGLHWNDLLALPKRDAQDLGVRKLKFVGTAELTPYEAMQEKLFTLATCRPQDFNSGLKYSPESRSYSLRKPRIRQQLLNAAINANTYGK